MCIDAVERFLEIVYNVVRKCNIMPGERRCNNCNGYYSGFYVDHGNMFGQFVFKDGDNIVGMR